jgi:branched-chain amino acid transport system permease protein
MALILGGLTNFVEIFAGALLIGISEALGTVYISGTAGLALPYALFVLVLLARPQGFGGTR